MRPHYTILFSVVLTSCSLYFASCGSESKPHVFVEHMNENDKFDLEAFIEVAQKQFDGAQDSTLHGQMAQLYNKHHYEPFWVDEQGVLAFTTDLISTLDSLQYDGIPAAHYQLDELRNTIVNLQSNKASLQQFYAFDTLCTHLLLKAAFDLKLGCLSASSIDSSWFHSNDSALYVVEDFISPLEDGLIPNLNTYRSQLPFYQTLQKQLRHFKELSIDSTYLILMDTTIASTDAMRKQLIRKLLPSAATIEDSNLISYFQYSYQLPVTKKIDLASKKQLYKPIQQTIKKIALNLERLRWLPTQLDTTYALVNVPAMEFYLCKQTNVDFEMRVVVGKKERPTPSLGTKMTSVLFNPYWGVPPTIMKKDVLPGITKSGENYLIEKDLKVFTKTGKEIPRSKVTPKNYNNYIYRQDPGDLNSLGVIKFNMPNKYDIYLHDTPHKEDFPNRDRARSSGCIRAHKPKELALFVLNNYEQNTIDANKVDSIIAKRKSLIISLKHKIPVHIVYLTCFMDSTLTQVRFLNDVYKRDTSFKNYFN